MTTGALQGAGAEQPTIQLYGQSLAPQERSKHRFWIGLRVEALLDPYWQTRPAEAVKEMIVADWLDSLEAFTPQEITAACREYVSGASCSRKPKPGDIRSIILARRQAEVARMPKRDEAPRDTATDAERARAAEIVREAGLSVRMPK